MNNHLSHEQFAKCFVGGATGAERQHIRDCGECSAELERFGNTVTSLRSAVRGRVDARVASQPPGITQSPDRPALAGNPKWRGALATAAVVLLGIVPFLTSERNPREGAEQTSSETSPNALMDAVNLHLSRTVPAPMQPVMALIPNDESAAESGGVR